MTPLMKQYNELKKNHPDAILLFRVGDFYETFRQDAIDASQILGITLTRRATKQSEIIELAGFPHHALDTYLPKLIHAGRRVAICEQLEDPKSTKKIEKRQLTEFITPTITPTRQEKPDYSAFISLLTAIKDLGNKIYTLGQIAAKSKELRDLALSIGVTPKKAFEAYYDYDYQPSLFD